MKNRNSGIWEGKFLERSKYKNIENYNKQFNISNFEIGKRMIINAFLFMLLMLMNSLKNGWMKTYVK